MKISVGSKNITKVAAVKDAAALYPKIFPDAEVVGVDVKVDLYGHPKNIKKIAEGAVDRAKQAFFDCEYSFGLESGMIEVPHTKSGYMEIQICAIYDGKEVCTGMSPGFEWPKQVTELVLKGDIDASTALKTSGLTEHEKMGNVEGGVINMLTNGRMTREHQILDSIVMAMIQIERPELY